MNWNTKRNRKDLSCLMISDSKFIYVKHCKPLSSRFYSTVDKTSRESRLMNWWLRNYGFVSSCMHVRGEVSLIPLFFPGVHEKKYLMVWVQQRICEQQRVMTPSFRRRKNIPFLMLAGPEEKNAYKMALFGHAWCVEKRRGIYQAESDAYTSTYIKFSDSLSVKQKKIYLFSPSIRK